ncbi:type I polyketide synthase [Micromonospora aurantiaca (nom. illeg.)]|uniref:type I polyketide synthase n=1 Tax=Micromonospora aurantiaca (nom. illeg.) TaxID=47850 RepID=UPI003EB6E5A1
MTGTRAPIVVVGMACRYPDATDPGQLWQTVLGRRRAFRPLPPERLPVADYHRPGRDEVDHTYVDRAAVLSDWVFDRSRFHVPGEVFRAVDLTHWLALEVAADALADADCPAGAGLPNDRVGVMLGNSMTGEFSRANGLRLRWPYVQRLLAETLAGLDLSDAEREKLLATAEDRFKEPFPPPGEETLAGALSNTIAGRICNHFDFHGTGYTVDAACASSLMAVATAARMLADGDLDVALAGGVDLSLDPLELVGFARVGALATGDMRIYDSRPTGFLPGEGCGILVLCREDFAAEHGLRPYARLHGWGTSSDGNGGLTRPEPAGQLLALRRAYDRAGLTPEQVSFVEGHGTGTAVGDETELSALRDLHAGRRLPAVLGSVKANIGHTKAAAGVAGMIKAVLAIHHQVIPPTTGCESPHPALAAAGSPLVVTDEPTPWPGPDRYASVSAMGFGGINAHVVLGGISPTTRRVVTDAERRAARPLPSHEVVVCAAADRAALAARLTDLADLAGRLSRAELGDLAATLAAEPVAAGAVRFAAVVRDPDGLVHAARRAVTALADADTELFDPEAGVFLGAGAAPRIGYLFSGQGSPVRPDAGALGELLDGPLAGYDSEVEIAAGGVPDTAVAQPAILRASLAGLAWLRRLGVEAEAAAGHSLGEIGALCWAGALDDKEALDLVRVRGRLMSDAPGRGAMAAVAGPADRVRELLRPGPLVVAGENSAEQCTVSGPAAEVARFVAGAPAAGLRATALPVSHAFHSPLMAPASLALRDHLTGLAGRAPRRPVCSTVTGDWLGTGTDLADLLTRQLVEPVRFRDALARLAARTDLLIEVGPGAVLAGLAADLPDARVVALDSGAPGPHGIATVTAALFATGAGPDVSAYYARRACRRLTPDWRPVFLRNPCEGTGGSARTPQPARPRPAPVTPTPAPPVVTADDTDLLSAVTRRVAAMVELDAATLRPDTRLVADLHLSSLRVSQLAVDAAAAVGRSAPAVPAALADATIDQLAAMLATLPAAGEVDAPPAGIASWVRAFTDRFVESAAPTARPGARRGWTVLGTEDHPLSKGVAEHFPLADTPDARLLLLPPGLTVPAELVVTALRATAADGLPLVVLHHGGVGAAVGRSIAMERPGAAVMVAETPVDDRCLKLVAEASVDWTGYVEAVYDEDGVRTTRVAAPLALSRRDERIPLASGDVLLVTGGAKGIGLECAAEVCQATGATAVLFGRSPGTDPEVRAGLDRLTALGITAGYHTVDVSDGQAVTAAVTAAQERYGPVRGLLHAAGHNTPRRIEDVTVEGLRATLAPKADGFDHLVAALGDDLRFAVAFGSVIGRTGLTGQSEYAVANEWLARRCAELTRERPRTRWLTVQWSAWSGVGMGVRLGVLDALVRDGLEPISVPAGTDLLLRLLAAPDTGPCVLAAGRLPAGPTLRYRDDDRTGGRFAERVLALTPGVESVLGATLTAGTDPYLSDHVVDGVPLLPAVLGLEAMTQAATALTGAPGTPVRLTGVRLERPVTVTDRRDIRVAALVHDDGRVETALRSDDTGFAVDHFAAVVTTGAVPAPDPAVPAPAVRLGEPGLSAAGLYGGLYFHGPAFRRVRGYHALSAYRCVFSVRAEPGTAWFGMYLDASLRLGDPGARDAVLHGLQGCVPDRRVLPVSVERITVWHRPSGVLTVTARQRAEDGAEFVYDVLVTDESGRPVEEWTGLVLRAVAEIGWSEMPAFLAGPAVARRLRHRHPGIDAAVLPATRGDGGPTLRLADWLAGAALGEPAGARHAGDGRVTAPGGGGVSASHLDDLVLVTVAPGPVGVDWERVDDRPPPLEERHRALAVRLAAESGEDEAVAAVRVWTAIEVTRKLGLGPSAPLVFTGREPSGTLGLRSGDHVLSSVLLRTAGDARQVAVCVGTPA